jgi:uncharacterized integral membrane protein (TIGR00697 family)
VQDNPVSTQDLATTARFSFFVRWKKTWQAVTKVLKLLTVENLNMRNEIIFLSSCIATAGFTLLSLLFGIEGLVAAVCVQGLLENIFVLKQIQLFGLQVTCADVFAVGLVFALNLVQEFYGKQGVTRAIGAYFLVSFWFLAARTAHLAYIPSPADSTHGHFLQLLEMSPRIIWSSLATSLIALNLDRFFYAAMRNFFTGNSAWVCNMLSTAVSQLFDTVIFTYLALAGAVENPGNIILVSYVVKLVAIFLAGPFAVLARPIFGWCRVLDS